MEVTIENSKLKLREELVKENVVALEGGKDMYRCCVCLCDISGHMQAESHVIGAKHAKKIKIKLQELHLKQIMSESECSIKSKKICLEPTITLPEVEAGSTAAALTLQPSEFYCLICQVGLNGAATLQQHNAGTKHAKKLKNEEMRRSLGSVYSSSSRSSSASPSPVSDSVRVLKRETDQKFSAANCNGESSNLSEILDFKNKLSITNDSDELLIVEAKDPIPKLF